MLLEFSLFSNNKDSRSHDGIFNIHFLVLANIFLVHHSQKNSIRNGNKSTMEISAQYINSLKTEDQFPKFVGKLLTRMQNYVTN